MKREIKFRAWSKSENYMYENITLSEDNEHIEDGTFEIMQFIGLKDKNGKEIYEGDILKVPNMIGDIRNRLVIYNAPSFWLAKNTYDTIDVEIFSTPNIDEEIIGNIYKNPELLEK